MGCDLDNIMSALKYKGFLDFCREIIYCKGFRKFTGLMFSKPKCAIIDLEKITKPKMHNMFVFYSLKLLFFDENLNLVEEVVLKPFRFFKARKRARFVLEIPLRYVGYKNHE